MTIPKNCKVELSASADANRRSICEPYLDIETGADGSQGRAQLVATDGRIMAVVPVTPNEHDVSGYVSEEVLKAGRKLAGSRAPYVAVACNGNATFGDGYSMPRAGTAEGTYPNWRQVLPAKVDAPLPTKPLADGEEPAPVVPPTHCIVALDISLLWKLAQSLGVDCLRLQIPVDGTGAIRVDACPGKGQDPAGAHGVIMPMRLS